MASFVRDVSVSYWVEEKYCLGDHDRSLSLTITRGGKTVYSEGGPPLAGMAIRKDGTRLYIQRCAERATGRERSFTTVDLATGEKLDEPHPCDPAEVEMLLALEPCDEAFADLGNETCHPPFLFSRPLELSAKALGTAERVAALDELLARPPSEEVWRDLLALFRDFHGAEAEAAAARAAERLARWPEARYRRAPPWLDWLAPHPAWRLVPAGVTTLELEARALGDAGLARLLAMPQLAQLRVLSLRDAGIGPEGARALASSELLAHLTHLELAGNPLGSEGAEAIARSPRARGLLRLGLERCGIDDRGVAALASSPELAALETLLLEENPTSDACGELLLASPLFRPRPRTGQPPAIWITHARIRRVLHEGFPSFQTRGRATEAPAKPAAAPARPPAEAKGPRTPRWTRELELDAWPSGLCAAPDGGLVVLFGDTILCAGPTGKPRWRREGGRRGEPWQPRPAAARVASDGGLWIAYDDGGLDRLELASGESVARVRPGAAELLHGGVTLALAPHDEVAVLSGYVESGCREGTNPVRLVAWELASARARWVSTYTLRHQMTPVTPELLPDGSLLLIVEERTGGGGVVSATTLRGGTLARGLSAAALEVASEGERLLALHATGDELFALCDRSLGRLDLAAPGRPFRRLALDGAVPAALRAPLALHGRGEALACLASEGPHRQLVVARAGELRRYALAPEAHALAFSVDGKLWVSSRVGYTRGRLARLGSR